MDEYAIDKMARFLTTEHAALQAARNALVSEGNGRTASFLNAISAGIVALALVYNISRLGGVFLLFCLILIPILGFMGISAYVRMVQIDLADVAYTSAINRVRRFYVETIPEIEQYSSFPAFDDQRSVLRARVIYTSLAWTVLSYPSGLILVINGLLAGALCSLLVSTLTQAGVLVAAGLGVLVFVLASVLQYRLGTKWFADVREDFEPRFPEPTN